MTEPKQRRDVAIREGWLTLPDRYARQLTNCPNDHSALIPRDDLGPLVQVIEHRLRPATPKELAGALSLITAAWPGYDRLGPEVAAAHLRMLREDLATFPAAVLMQAITELRRTLKFTPSIAEFYQAASEFALPDRDRLVVAKAHMREHARRDAVAQAEAERQAERQREQEARIAKLAQLHGAAWPACAPEQLDQAWEGMACVRIATAVEWSQALDAGERWAAAALPLAAAAGRVSLLSRARKITGDEGSQLVWLLGRDLDRGCNLIALIEAGNAPAGWADADPGNVWECAPRVLGDLVDELRRRHATVPV